MVIYIFCLGFFADKCQGHCQLQKEHVLEQILASDANVLKE